MADISQRIKVTRLIHRELPGRVVAVDNGGQFAPVPPGNLYFEQVVEEFVAYGMSYNGFFLGIRLSGEDTGDHPDFVLLPINSIMRVDIEGVKGAGKTDQGDAFKRLFGEDG